MLIGAATFDKLDGAVARRLGLTEPLPEDASQRKLNVGNLMDDFADAISFCIAPAWIFYIALIYFGEGRFNTNMIIWIAAVYAMAGLARLIYFTVDKNPIPGFFKGLPTPAAALLVLSPLVIYDRALTDFPAYVEFWGHFSIGLMLLTAVVMNLYPVHYIHMGRAMSRNAWINRLVILVVIFCAFTPYLGQVSLGLMILFLFSPLVTRRIPPDQAAREKSVKQGNLETSP